MSTHRTIESYVSSRAPHLAPRAVTHTSEPAPRLRYIVAVLVALAAAVIVLAPLTPTPAHADPTPAPDGLYVVRVDPAPAGPRITVTLSNGATDKLHPCRYEDGRRCFWLAEQRGNRVGRSYVVTRGHVFYLNLTRFTS